MGQRKRRRAWAWLVAGCIGCGSSSAPEPQPLDVQIDTYNLGLAGRGVPAEAERRAVQLVELPKLTGDLLCLEEVWQESDKQAFKTALAANYPYSAWAKTDRTTKIDGVVTPPPPTTAPCAGKDKELEAVVSCLGASCAADGKLTSTQCAKDNCTGAVLPLLGADDKSCYGCLVSNMVSEPLDGIAPICSAPGLGLGFGGQSSAMLLSKHPLDEVSQLVVPGCWQQRSVVHAVATLTNGAKVDVYCNHLSPVNSDDLLPYTCPWGGGATTTKAAWEAEQKLQIDAIVAFAKNAKHRVVFLGDLNASPAVPSPPASGAPIDGYGQYVLDTLANTYVEALAVGYVPTCTFCKSNPLVAGVENTWLDHIFLGGIDKSRVRSTSRTFDAELLPAPWLYMSDHFGMRAVVTFDP